MQISNILLQNLKGEALAEIARASDASEKATKQIAAEALPLILSQMEIQTQDPLGANELNSALNAHLGTSKINRDDGAKILSHIFDDISAIYEVIAKRTSTSQEDASHVMQALASIIMETLGDHKAAASGLTDSDLARLLAGTGKDSNILEMVMQETEQKDEAIASDVGKGMGFLKKMIRKRAANKKK